MLAVVWGSVADWFAAISTGGAFIAAVLVYFHDRGNRKLDSEARAKDVEDRRKSQASLVHFLYKLGEKSVELANVSPQEVFDVTLDVGKQSYALSAEATNPSGIIEPATSHKLELLTEISKDDYIRMLFTDAAGRRWIRNNRGDLTQTHPTSGSTLGLYSIETPFRR